eukprot:g13304.t1
MDDQRTEVKMNAGLQAMLRYLQEENAYGRTATPAQCCEYEYKNKQKSESDGQKGDGSAEGTLRSAEDWILAESYWNCIRPNTWSSEAGGGAKLEKEKQKWRSDEPDHKVLRHRPSDVVNTLTWLDVEEKRLLKTVEEQQTQLGIQVWHQLPARDEQMQKLKKIQAAKEKYRKAFPFATKGLLPLMMHVHGQVSTGYDRFLNFLNPDDYHKQK